ncbi:hypothetical protein [Actinomadura litoris]|uniref:hypothetical protein n=1 Tax=Actinomadura litoris TaxID=2678616 RepID=UPI001FA6F310|nr:hypothetical protein [Actinomadura litoris]
MSMTAALKRLRTVRTPQFHDPADAARQLVIAEFGGRVLPDPVTQTHFCLACLEDVPADLIHEGLSACCLV